MTSPARPAVLCVDDEPEILAALSRTLRREPYEVLTAGSGLSALERLDRDEVDVIISDERMPEMSGLEFLGQVRRRRPWIRLVILTGYPSRPIPTDGDDALVDLLLAKPWNDSDLKQSLRRLLREASEGRRPSAPEDPGFDVGGESG
jgi:CheY-like chemotaxis protein